MSKPQPIYEQGNLIRIEYRNDQGQIHREDGPAIICPDGYRSWSLNGNFHRDHGPTIIFPSGTLFWYQNNKFHREDGPAIIRADGTQEWFLDGEKFNNEEQWSHALWSLVEDEQYQLIAEEAG